MESNIWIIGILKALEKKHQISLNYSLMGLRMYHPELYKTFTKEYFNIELQ